MKRILVALGVLLVALAGVYLWPQIEASQKRLDAIESEQKGVSRDIERLERATSGGSDKRRIEELARNRLGMVKKGEKSFVITDGGEEAGIQESTSDAASQDAEQSSPDVTDPKSDNPAPSSTGEDGVINRVMAFFGLLPSPKPESPAGR